MFLLHIDKNKIKENNLLQISHVQNVSKKIKNQIVFFKKLKKAGTIKKLRFLISKTDIFKPYRFESHNTIKYIIGITIYHRNTIIYLSDIKGTIKFFCSTGTLKMNRNQKQKKIPVLIKLIKILIPKINIIPKKDRIALHLKNFNQHLSFFALNFLLNHREIDMLKINNTEPHNGCRPRKPKRKKTQRLNFG
jgi:uncharacterized protein YehS (DUF1456 family)